MDPATAKSKLQDPEYSIVQEFDNEVVKVTLRWQGKVVNGGNTLPEFWPLFILDVMNYNESGALVPDPTTNGQTFGSEKAGIKAYQEFLNDWTDCTVDHNGVFKEVGNTLVPPPPPDPDMPLSQPVGEQIGCEGAW